jgi:hypothetical protein
MNLQENIGRIKEVMGISESNIPISIKRRANLETLKKFISKAEIQNENPCDDFEDEYDFVDAVIDDAIDYFLTEIGPDTEEIDEYSDILDYLRNLCRDLFAEKLLKIYEETCS